MKMPLLLSVVLIAGCCFQPQGEKGPRGDPGYQGADGLPGPQGPPGPCPAIIWKNAAGTTIAYGEIPLHRDGDGYWWPVETDLGQVDLLKTPSARIVYASTNCTGPAFYQGAIVGAAAQRPPFYPPRTPFFVAAENGWRVRSDAAKVQIINIQSTSDGSTCSTSQDMNEPVLPTGPASSTVIGPPPDLGSTGPLHRELAQP